MLFGRLGASCFRREAARRATEVYSQTTTTSHCFGLHPATGWIRSLDVEAIVSGSSRARLRPSTQQKPSLTLAASARLQAVAKKNWCVPKLTEEFRERMEDVLTLYERPHDPTEPVVCLDEQPYQLLEDVRLAQPAAPGRIAKQDYEYRRRGTCAIFVAVEPTAGRRHTWVHARRTKREFAYIVRDLLRRYPKARCVHLVLDNLNTHGLHSLREVLAKPER